MKMKTGFLMCVLSMAAVSFSCQKQEFEEIQVLPKVDAEFAALTEAGIPTRMTLGTDLTSGWIVKKKFKLPKENGQYPGTLRA